MLSESAIACVWPATAHTDPRRQENVSSVSKTPVDGVAVSTGADGGGRTLDEAAPTSECVRSLRRVRRLANVSPSEKASNLGKENWRKAAASAALDLPETVVVHCPPFFWRRFQAREQHPCLLLACLSPWPA
jgi:hypothetical protein